MRMIASVAGSIATIMYGHLREQAFRDQSQWRRGPSRTRDRLCASFASEDNFPSARSCMSLSRGHGNAAGRAARPAPGPSSPRPRLVSAAPEIGRAGETASATATTSGFRSVERRQVALGGHVQPDAVTAKERRYRATATPCSRAARRLAAACIDGPGKAMRARRRDLVGLLPVQAARARSPGANRHSRRRPSWPQAQPSAGRFL